MILYHGSTVVVQNPDVKFGRKNLDFGQGFYTTNLKAQAEKWVQRFLNLGKRAFVSVYDFDDYDLDSKCRHKKFEYYSEDWLDFILSCRNGGSDFLNYDIIEGGIANDKVFNTVELYFDGLIEKTEALKRLKYEKPNKQLCFINQTVLNDLLKFTESYEVQNAGK